MILTVVLQLLRLDFTNLGRAMKYMVLLLLVICKVAIAYESVIYGSGIAKTELRTTDHFDKILVCAIPNQVKPIQIVFLTGSKMKPDW